VSRTRGGRGSKPYAAVQSTAVLLRLLAIVAVCGVTYALGAYAVAELRIPVVAVSVGAGVLLASIWSVYHSPVGTPGVAVREARARAMRQVRVRPDWQCHRRVPGVRLVLLHREVIR
jgi:hypothetical protein